MGHATQVGAGGKEEERVLGVVETYRHVRSGHRYGGLALRGLVLLVGIFPRVAHGHIRKRRAALAAAMVTTVPVQRAEPGRIGRHPVVSSGNGLESGVGGRR